MHDRISLVSATVALVCSTACATMTHELKQEVAIDSSPSGAHVFVNDKDVGRTPVSVRLSRHSRPTIRFEKEGFVAETVALKRSVSNWIAADVALSLNPMAIQGMDSASDYPKFVASTLFWTVGIDFATGAAFKFRSSITVTLQPEPGACASNPQSANAQPTVIRLGS